MAAEVLIDTSVWIDYFRKPDSETGEKVLKHLKRGSLSTCGVIVFEVLQGAADREEFAFLEENLKGLHFLEANEEVFFEAAKISYDLRKHGITLPLSDILIAALAMANHQTIWTKDQHFKKKRAFIASFFDRWLSRRGPGLGEEATGLLRFQIGTSKGRGGRRYLPYVFTQEGVAMLSSVLRSQRAVRVNVQIMRAFVRLRDVLAVHKDLARRLESLEKKFDTHDAQIKLVFETIRDLMRQPEKPKGPIGFV